MFSHFHKDLEMDGSNPNTFLAIDILCCLYLTSYDKLLKNSSQLYKTPWAATLCKLGPIRTKYIGFESNSLTKNSSSFLHQTFQISNPENAKSAECLWWSFWTCNRLQFLTSKTTSEAGMASTNKKAILIELESFFSLLRFFLFPHFLLCIWLFHPCKSMNQHLPWWNHPNWSGFLPGSPTCGRFRCPHRRFWAQVDGLRLQGRTETWKSASRSGARNLNEKHEILKRHLQKIRDHPSNQLP